MIEDMGAWMADQPSTTTATPNSTKVDPKKKGGDKKKDKDKKKGKGGPAHIFGMSLHDLYEQSGHPVPVFVVHCLKYFKKSGALKLEGIFRVSGLKHEVEQLQALFPTAVDLGNFEDVTGDPHAVASLLKAFYRDLPEPVMTFSLSWEVYELYQALPENKDAKIQKMKEIIARLPKINMINARFLLEFLNTILIYSEVNKMTEQNLSIVWGPNLFRVEDSKNSMSVVASQFELAATEFLISHYKEIFEGLGTESMSGKAAADRASVQMDNKSVMGTQEVVVWPYSPFTGTIQRKMIQKKNRTCDDFVKSLAVRMGVDPSELQLVKVEVKELEDSGDKPLVDVLEQGNICLKWKGKISDTVSLPPE